MDKMRVLARGGSLVLDLGYAKQTGQRRYLGRTAVQATKLEDLPEGEPCHQAHNQFLEPDDEPMPHYAFPKSGIVAVIPAPPHEFGKEYMDEIRAGNLWPADKETATFCGLQFDATFGGEYPSVAPAKTPSKKSE